MCLAFGCYDGVIVVPGCGMSYLLQRRSQVRTSVRVGSGCHGMQLAPSGWIQDINESKTRVRQAGMV